MENNLKFKDGKFRVMLVGDPHENEDISTPEARNKVKDYLNLQYAAVKKLKPDVVVLMGDNATASTEENLREVLLRITAPYRENDIPFAFVIGNHDLECEVSSLETQYDIYRTLPNCLLPSKDEVNSFGDYDLPVKSCNSDKDVLNLRFIYSGNLAEKKYFSKYDFVKPRQLSEFKARTKALADKNGGIVPSVVFQHIPVCEEYKLMKKTGPASMLTDGVRGQCGQSKSYYRLSKDATGYLGEAVCPPDYNSGEFEAWKESGDVFAAFFGHDHLNDFIGTVDGILLGQCKLSGFRQYGDGMRQGVRILNFDENDIKNPETKMYYYRDLVGNSCNSIKGMNLLPDRITTKLDVLAKVAPAVGAVAGLLVIGKIIGKK